MAHKNKYPGIDRRITRIIAQQVGKLAGRYGITFADIADIEQDIHLRVWFSQLDTKDPSFECKVHQIVRNSIIDIIRFRQRECRDWRQEAFSTNASTEDAEDPDEDIAHILDLEDKWCEGFGLPPSWHHRRDKAADVANALAGLPDDVRELACALEACGGNLMGACRLLGIGRKKGRLMLESLQQTLAWLRVD